jgi:hypothetical protein
MHFSEHDHCWHWTLVGYENAIHSSKSMDISSAMKGIQETIARFMDDEAKNYR